MLKEKTYTVNLCAKEPLRIGGKKDPLSGADNPVTRVGEKLVIPGPSLKGALRAEIERFLIDSYFINGGWKEGFEDLKPCVPGDKSSEDEKRLISAGKYREKGCRYLSDKKEKQPEKTDTGPICPACYLLGSMGLNGFVRVPFLYASASAAELYSSRIDRATRTIVHGTNRPYELVPDGTIFSGTLTVLLEDSILGWKVGEARTLDGKGDKWLKDGKGKISRDEFVKTYVLDRLEAIKTIGGYKSKGFGNIQITIEST